MAAKRILYNLQWEPQVTDAEIEMWMIRHPENKGFVSPTHHYGRMRKAIWPELDDESNGQRWHKLCRDEIRRKNAKITVLLGAGSSGKTHEAAWNYLCEYYVFPEETCVLVSSTDLRGLELRVWGEIKSLHDRAVSRFNFIPGILIDSKHCISTDDVEDGDVRDIRKGIVAVPTIQGGKMIGLGKWVGIKQKRMRLVADEAQFMSASFLSAFSNLDKNVDFQAIVLGNPVDVLDPLGRAAEPKDGWTSHLEPTKTETWDTKFMNGRCVNLIGTDSPNFDFDPDKPAKFPYLISRQKIANTLSFFTKDSIEYFSQCVGSMKIGMLNRRVITRDMCEKFGAMETPIWHGDSHTTRIASLDSAYGGDRCPLTDIEFGKAVDGKIIINIIRQVIVPISVRSELIPEDQISEFCKSYCEAQGIPPENFFHDSTGRGSLGTSLARMWSPKCNPVEFGGSPTARPVSLDLSIKDDKTGQMRLKRCDEHYSKWVTEAWWAVRLAIESQQFKGMTEEIMEEGCMREWKMVKGFRIEIESKLDMKERVGRSPDLFDSLVIAVEGARRLGFHISKAGKEATHQVSSHNNWIHRSAAAVAKLNRSRMLQSV